MFETRIQTWWADADPAQIVFFPNFFRYLQCAEEELYRASGKQMMAYFNELGVSMPRVESFAKFSKPIHTGDAIVVQVQTEFSGEKVVKMSFTILNADDRSHLAAGYVTAVCMNSATKKSCPMPPEIRAVYALAATENNS